MTEKFAERLKQLRSENNVGQIQLSQKIGVSKGVISLWENGLREPKLSNLVLLANYFNVSIDELVGRNDRYEQ